MVRNKKLKEALQLLSRIILPFYKSNLPLDERSRKAHLYVSIEMGRLENKVTEKQEFNTCVNLMKKDENIKALQGKTVGTFSSRTIVRDEKTCILSFLTQIYLKSPEYNQELFEHEYLCFEELFYSDKLRLRDSARLYNFQFDGEEIQCNHETKIRRQKKPGLPQVQEVFEGSFSSHVFRASDFLIEREYARKKIVGDQSIVDKNKFQEEETATRDLFDLVITVLRILKPSGVYRDHGIKTKTITFHPASGTLTSFPLFENVAAGEKCSLEEKELDEFKKIFTFLVKEKDTRFVVAQNRLTEGVARKKPEDQLIDYMVGLEALYLPDGNQELTFRICMRVAFLLFSVPVQRKETYNFLKGMYGIRSKIIHGKNYNLNKDDINRLGNLLRKSIKLWIEDKGSFSQGKLIDIFFAN